MTQEEDNLRLLSIFHYIVGGLTAFVACFPMIHVVLGLVFIFAPEKLNEHPRPGQAPPEFLGWIFVVVGGLFIIGGWSLAASILFAGRCLAHRTRYTFCVVIAAFECIFMPFGTVLGVFTLIVLTKASAKQLFFPNEVFLPANEIDVA